MSLQNKKEQINAKRSGVGEWEMKRQIYADETSHFLI